MGSRIAVLAGMLLAGWAGIGQAADEADVTKLAKELQNPVANLISVPFQFNFNYDYGPEDDTQGILNIQPVIPISVSDDLNLITRTIVPVLSQPGFGPGDASRTYGLGDIQLSGFLSPAKPGEFIWGVGAITQLKTASHDNTGQGRWGLGPTAVALKMTKEWVFGGLINNVFDVGGDGDREKINQMLFQPFINYNFPTHPGRYLSFSPVVTADWKADSGDKWTVPVGLGLGQVFKLGGKLPVNVQAAYYYNVVTPDDGPDYQIRLQWTFMFPK
jgi:hypothetical protein